MITAGEEVFDVAGWLLSISVASTSSTQGPAPLFYGTYRPEKPPLNDRQAAIIFALGGGSLVAEADRQTAAIAAEGVADGFFGASETISNSRAMSRSLASINSWIFSASRSALHAPGSYAALTALVFSNNRIGLANAGSNTIYRLSDGELVSLSIDGSSADKAERFPSRGVGAETDLLASYSEEIGEENCCYIVDAGKILSHVDGKAIIEGIFEEREKGHACRLLKAAEKASHRSLDGAIAIVRIMRTPKIDFDGVRAAFADLPMRPIPQESDNWDGFIIGRTLYRGRYVIIKRAWDSIEKRDVVLKIPLPAMSHDEVFRAGFIRETWLGTSLRSRWIADYIDIPSARRTSLYLVRPYYRGKTLEEHISASPKISLVDGVGIALNLCSAVSDLEEEQVIHGDLKPQNVILLHGNDLKLLDMGFASVLGFEDPRAIQRGGTAQYMAPEIFKGSSPNSRSEVFSLGVMIYRIFSGGAFPSGRQEAIPLRRLRPDLPQWLGECIATALQPNSDRRFLNADALRDALSAGLARGDWNSSAPQNTAQSNVLIFWRMLALGLAVLVFVLLVVVIMKYR